jgi:hypothetical protein
MVQKAVHKYSSLVQEYIITIMVKGAVKNGTIHGFISTRIVESPVHIWYSKGIHQGQQCAESFIRMVQYRSTPGLEWYRELYTHGTIHVTTTGPEWYRELDTKLYNSP